MARRYSLRREAVSVSAAKLALVVLRSGTAVVLTCGVRESTVGRYYVRFRRVSANKVAAVRAAERAAAAAATAADRGPSAR